MEFSEWMDRITRTLRRMGLRVQMTRDHFAYLIGLFWDGITIEVAIDWMQTERLTIAADQRYVPRVGSQISSPLVEG